MAIKTALPHLRPFRFPLDFALMAVNLLQSTAPLVPVMCLWLDTDRSCVHRADADKNNSGTAREVIDCKRVVGVPLRLVWPRYNMCYILNVPIFNKNYDYYTCHVFGNLNIIILSVQLFYLRHMGLSDNQA